MDIKRYPGNPIVTPGKYDWRRAVTFNPGALYEDGKVYLFERAGGTIRPLKCQTGLLVSDDGFHFEHVYDEPIVTADQLGKPLGTIEDPRVVKIDDTYYMVYAHRPYTYNCNPNGLGVPDYAPIKGELDCGINNTRSGIAISKNMKDWEHIGFCTPPDVDDRDNILFPEKINGQFAMLRRPMTYIGPEYGCDGPAMWISYSTDLKEWSKPNLIAKAENEWEGGRIGASAPPLRTDEGWLTLYHGVDKTSTYRLGVMLLDGDNPEKVIARIPHSIMQPEEYYEKFGLVIPNVIFPTGNIIKDDTLFIYYGCADTCISVATVPVAEILGELLKYKN